MDISIIIINWNGRGLLENCLQALEHQTLRPLEIIVVDNASTDDSVAWLQTQHPTVKLICNERNLGFAAANNQGWRVARGEAIALLNNDAWPEPTWLAHLVAPLTTDARLGMVASKMVFAHQPNLINSVGIGIDRCGVVWDEGGGQGADEFLEPAEIFGPCAGAGLYRRALLDDVGLFDEDFFAYLEDVDLAWRARWRGWRAGYAPTAIVHHVHSASFQEGSALKTFLLARNKIWVLVKNYPAPYVWLYLPLILLYDAASLAYALWRGQGHSAWRGRWQGWTALRAVWRKRQAIQAPASTPPQEIFSWLQPVRAPWHVLRRHRRAVVRAQCALARP